MTFSFPVQASDLLWPEALTVYIGISVRLSSPSRRVLGTLCSCSPFFQSCQVQPEKVLKDEPPISCEERDRPFYGRQDCNMLSDVNIHSQPLPSNISNITSPMRPMGFSKLVLLGTLVKSTIV